MNYQLSTLPNGLKVVTVPMRERNSAGVAIWVKTGGRYETPGVLGVSHFLEHMLFKGTKTRTTRGIKEEIEGVGGMLNAFTGEESTCYFAKLPKNYFVTALEVLSDMVNHATLSAEELRKERTVILEELKMYRDLPAHHVHDLMGELLWPNQPLGRPLVGTEETVAKLKRSQIMSYKKRYYHPKNIVVSVSGQVDHDDVVERVKDYFSQSTRHGVSMFRKANSRQSKPRTMMIEKQTEQTHFVIGLHTFSRYHPDRYKLEVLNVILGANMSSRLFEEVREKRGLAYEIKSGLSFYQDTGALSVSAGVESKKTPTAIRVILAELSKMQKRPARDGELKRAKDYYVSQLTMALEDTLDHLLWVGEKALYLGEMPDLEEIKRGIEAVTAADIQKISREIFRTPNLNLTLIGPIPPKIQSRIKHHFEMP